MIPHPPRAHLYSPNPATRYDDTNRGFDELEFDIYPGGWLAELTPEMTVLDVGAGKGQFVEDLRKMKIPADGFDKKQSAEYVTKLDIDDTTEDTFKEKYDRIFSTWSLFSYPCENYEFQKRSLQKMASWLKPGGKIRLSPVNYLLDSGHLKDILPDNLELSKRRLCEGRFIGKPIKCIELTKKS